jgi:hypothetical protein
MMHIHSLFNLARTLNFGRDFSTICLLVPLCVNHYVHSRQHSKNKVKDIHVPTGQAEPKAVSEMQELEICSFMVMK